MILNRYCSDEREFNTLFQNMPTKAHIRINNIHNVEYRDKWVLRSRQIDEYILVHIRNGDGCYLIDNTKINFRKGSIILISPEISFSAQGGTVTPSLYSIRFQFIDNEDKKMLDIHEEPLYMHYYDNSMHYNEMFENLYSNYIMTYNKSIKICFCNSLMTEILCNLWQDINGTNNHFDMKINKARVFIEKNPLRKHTIGELAAISGFSESYFSKKFKQQFKMSPKSYIFKTKMKYGRNLLYEYSYTVKEAADLLGYSDPYIFSNQFKRVFGISPSKVSKIRK